MSTLKKLASQTAIYGVSSILGRLINYALTFIHTRALTNQADYGVVGELFAYITFINVIYLYGMETAYFRYAARFKEQEKDYFSSAFTSILITSVVLSGILLLSSHGILNLLSANETSAKSYYKLSYIYWFVLILAFDALTAIPFARLRQQNRPIKFATLKVTNILINVFFNVFWLWFCPWWISKEPSSILNAVYQPENKVSYIILANLIASVATLLMLHKELWVIKINIQWNKLKPMLVYGFPLVFAGLAGMMNETFGRLLLKYLLPGNTESNLQQLGIYNAAYKLSIFMTLAIQAFRMAAEPFFFSMQQSDNAPKTYARVMTYFVIVCACIFLAVTLNVNLIATVFLGPNYRQGLQVVPILLLANLFLGVYYNLSIWYKLADKTMYSIYFTVFGAIITVIFNVIWIPKYGYEGSSWATLMCYFAMAVVCYLIGQKYYKVPYQLKKIGTYLFYMAVMFFISKIIGESQIITDSFLIFIVNNSIILIFILTVYLVEKKHFILKK